MAETTGPTTTGRPELPPKAKRLGLAVIAFNDHRRNDVYGAPEQKDRARGGSWFMARITDMSDMYKGYVTVSGNYKVSLQNLRVILR